jgi:hypothetical protein
MRCASLLLVLALTGCASWRQPAAATPPWALLEDCPEPIPEAATNGGLARSLRALRDALRSCNDDKAALREWATKASR